MNKAMTETKRKTIYPYLIMLTIGGFLAFLAWSAYQASGLGSKVTDTDYYSKGLEYNSTMVEKRAAEVLGWQLEARLEGLTIEFLLTSQEGIPVDRAVGTLYLAIPGSAENIRLPLNEVGSGYYLVNLGDDISGTIQARLEFEREGARLNRQLLLNL